jgi:hypothetical protein
MQPFKDYEKAVEQFGVLDGPRPHGTDIPTLAILTIRTEQTQERSTRQVIFSLGTLMRGKVWRNTEDANDVAQTPSKLV